MAFKIINHASNPRKKTRLQKELQYFKYRMNKLELQSHRLLSGLQEIADKKLAEEKLKTLNIS